jgi:hypothetical protein
MRTGLRLKKNSTDSNGGDPKQRGVVRRAALVAAVVAAASLGLAGTGAVSATAPALHVKSGSQWTFIQEGGPGCEVDFFAGDHQFANDQGDTGGYTVSGQRIIMSWNSGIIAGGVFKGTLTSGKYTGTLHGPLGVMITSKLVQGARAGC